MSQDQREPTNRASPEEMYRLEFSVDWPPGHAAAYLLDCAEPVLFDAGVPGDRGERELREMLAQRGFEPADVEHLVLTHPHSDHVGQVTTVLEESEPTVYAPAGVRPRLDRPTDDLAAGVRSTAIEAGMSGQRADSAVKNAVNSLMRDRNLLPTEAIDVDLSYGEHYRIAGFDVEVVHTPGHQVDHACFQVGGTDGDLLVAGDMVISTFRSAALNVGIDDGAYGSVQDFYAAYDRLGGRDVAEVYPGHGPVFTEYEAAIESSVEDLDGMVEHVYETLATMEPETPIEVGKERAGDHLTASLLDTIGALGYLDDEGRVKYELEDGVRYYRTV
jgi:glyoxylase-like metal-dependent hydrolase (beta-lactamase superfamily II)